MRLISDSDDRLGHGKGLDEAAAATRAATAAGEDVVWRLRIGEFVKSPIGLLLPASMLPMVVADTTTQRGDLAGQGGEGR